MKRYVYIGAISSAVSCSQRAGSLSGPPAFEGVILFKKNPISISRKIILDIRMCGSDLGKSF